jgi:hypothetical protein
MLDEALTAVAVLLRAHGAGRKLSPRVVRRMRQQCTAATVVSQKLRKKLSRLKAMNSRS